VTRAVCPRCGTANPTGRLALCPRCFLSADADAEDEVPSLPGLDIVREIGRGGMGRVLLARHAGLGRDVAVKVLSIEVAAEPEFRARFDREAKTLARLDHPGIVRVHDFGTTAEGEAFLVMELVTGGTLSARIPLPIERAIEVAVELCAALAHAHDAGVVHRDVKPENVLVTADGRVKLTDFGIARLVEQPVSDVTRASQVLGTPKYMAPEARTGAKPDARMDVYSLGVMLHEMTTGRLPPGDSALLPASLAAIIRRATAADPGERTPSVRTLATELAGVEVGAGGGDDLPPEERTWVFSVAILLSVATAVAIYAGITSFTPRIVSDADALPLVAFGAKHLPDGRVLTLARFEVWPVLGAAVATAVALTAHGLLRRHLRHAGLDVPEPERSLAGSRGVFRFGVFLVALAVFRETLSGTSLAAVATYIPVLGGVLELAMLQRFWTVVLEAQRIRRNLGREPLLWLGLGLALLPPTYHFFREVAQLRP
jgi:eukaryotic-like serine/threonine-protein kinase